ncbi:ZIP family metal transporter [Rubrolithibacter danxiaensis]|uniref:ZIP family metal transporter n=1 Tax=Rubrolithibacter danxiaensis TaxID=3390805 RepID=UPI003BF9246B
MPNWLVAGLWGLFSGSALLIGALGGYFLRVSQKVVAMIMGFGAGVLISALSFELMDEAYHRGGFVATAIGFISGGVIYSIANYFLAHKGAKHRKRSEEQQPTEKENPGSGLAIAMGALLDGIPEAIAIGISMIEGGAVSVATVIAIFISNVPEGLSSSSGMKKAKRSKTFVFGLWSIIAILTSLGSIAGYTIFSHLSAAVMSATMAIAAGAILTMLADTMIPEAFEKGHNLTGIITVLGFLAAFVLSKTG